MLKFTPYGLVDRDNPPVPEPFMCVRPWQRTTPKSPLQVRADVRPMTDWDPKTRYDKKPLDMRTTGERSEPKESPPTKEAEDSVARASLPTVRPSVRG